MKPDPRPSAVAAVAVVAVASAVVAAVAAATAVAAAADDAGNSLLVAKKGSVLTHRALFVAVWFRCFIIAKTRNGESAKWEGKKQIPRLRSE